MPGMIVAAIVIEGLLKEWPDFYTLLTLLFLNGAVGFYEDLRSGDAVEALKASLKPEAQCKRNGKWSKMDSTLLVPGDRVALNAGANVPADVKVCKGMLIQVDQAAMTGESLPVTMGENCICKMGSTIVAGEVDGIVAMTGINTFYGKTAALIGQTHDVGNFQKVILEITQVLLVGSSVLVVIAVAYLIYREPNEIWEAISFGVVLLVASIPIAMQVVCTATMALGSRVLAAQKAIVSRLSSIEQLAGMNILCSDKTGTLTLNKMVLQEVISYKDSIDRNGVLSLAALAAKWKEPAKDALDTLVLNAVPNRGHLDEHEQLDYKPFDPVVKRTESTLKAKDGTVFEVIKGAPHIVLGMCSDANKAAVGKTFETTVMDLANRGIRALAVAKKEEGKERELVGLLTFLDPPRPDTKETIERAMMQGVSVKMITGDHRAIARETARSLGMGDSIGTAETLPTLEPGDPIPDTLGRDYGPAIENCDGFAQVFPEHKFLLVEALRQRGHMVGMTGDGVNDAPALKKADVGIAVEGATDAARAAADLVLTAPGLSVIIEAIIISRCIFQRMKNYVIYRVACTVQLLLFFFFALWMFDPTQYNAKMAKFGGHTYDLPVADTAAITEAGLPTDVTYGFRMTDHEVGLDIPTTFNLPVIALVVIVILNDATIISTAYDHVKPSSLPELWNLPILFTVATWIGLIATFSSLLLLHWALESEDPCSPIRWFGVTKSLSYGQVVAMMYLKISLSDWWTIFAARTTEGFYTRAPSPIVLVSAAFATLVSTVNSCYWPFQDIRFGQEAYLAGEPQRDIQLVGLELEHVIFTWIYTIIWFLIQDAGKTACYKVLYHFDVCQIQTNAKANEERMVKNMAIVAKKTKTASTELV